MNTRLKRTRYFVRKKREMLPELYDTGLLKKLRHPNIVRIYDVTEEGGIITFHEERVRKGTLLQWMNDRGCADGGAFIRPPGRRKIKQIMRQLCSAVGYLHEMKPKMVIHGDIKPDNIMMSRTGRVKLIDFSSSVMYEGAAKTDHPQDDGTMRAPFERTHRIYATARYAAPEVFEGEAGSPQRDIYGIGMTLLYLLRGDKALDAKDVEKEILTDKSAVHLDLLKIAYGCVRSDPDLRYHSAKEVASALKTCGFAGRRRF